MGIITPSDLHFERHHGGVTAIDPKNYSLLIHGMVERPMVFTPAGSAGSAGSAASVVAATTACTGVFAVPYVTARYRQSG